MATVMLNRKCSECKKLYHIPVDADAYHKWQNREMVIQQAFPDMEVGMRELLLSGICGKCFDKMFKGMEDDEDDE